MRILKSLLCSNAGLQAFTKFHLLLNFLWWKSLIRLNVKNSKFYHAKTCKFLSFEMLRYDLAVFLLLTLCICHIKYVLIIFFSLSLLVLLS